MNYSEVGIGVIDIYDDESLLKCIDRLAAISKDIPVANYIITNRKTPLKNFEYDKVISHQVSMATLRNHCLAHFRCNGQKYLFLVNSNVLMKDKFFIENTIKTAEAFGTWFMTGYTENPTVLDDDVKNQHLCINTKLNTDMVFLRSGVVGNLGYFDERYVNTKDLDVLDYINKARKLKLYPDHPFHPTIGDAAEYTKAKIEKIGHSDILSAENKSVGVSYGYFRHTHGYIPDMEETKTITKEEMVKQIGEMQEAYGKTSEDGTEEKQ